MCVCVCVCVCFQGKGIAGVKNLINREFPGGPMVRTQWLSLQARVQSLVGELRSHKPLGQKKKKEREKFINKKKGEIGLPWWSSG